MSKIRTLLHMPVDIWQVFISYYPGPIGFVLRRGFWKNRLRRMGNNVKIDVGVYFQKPQYITLDDNSWIDRNVIILAGPPSMRRLTHEIENPQFPLAKGEVHVGKNVHIAPFCVVSGIGGLYVGDNSGIAAGSAVYSFSHHYRNLTDRDDMRQYVFSPSVSADKQSMILGPVYIGDYCAVGLNCVILPGTTLSRGTWVASGAVVTGSYPEQALLRTDKGIDVTTLAKYKLIW